MFLSVNFSSFGLITTFCYFKLFALGSLNSFFELRTIFGGESMGYFCYILNFLFFFYYYFLCLSLVIVTFVVGADGTLVGNMEVFSSTMTPL